MLCCAVQVKWKDLVSDLNLVPTTMDVERTGAMDLGIGNLPLPFANFKKSECVAMADTNCSASIQMLHQTGQSHEVHMHHSLNAVLILQVQPTKEGEDCCTSSIQHFCNPCHLT